MHRVGRGPVAAAAGRHPGRRHSACRHGPAGAGLVEHLDGVADEHRLGDDADLQPLALDDAVRAHQPGEVLLSCLSDSRFGLTRKDLVEWAREKVEPETKLTHIPVRIEDDAIRWDLVHTLVVATQPVAAPDPVDPPMQEGLSWIPDRSEWLCGSNPGLNPR